MATASQSPDHGGGIDVMHQFDIVPWVPMHFFGFDISFTNSAFFALLGAVLIVLLVYHPARVGVTPTRRQVVVESLYEFVATMLRDSAGHDGMRYFPFVFTLFSFILTLNLLGMIPYAFTVTSHIAVTATLALTVFVGVTIIGFMRQGLGYLRIFMPSGVPAYMLPLIVPIEIISYFTRPFSLSIRLFVNMFVGHVLLKIVGGFVVMLGVFGIFPLLGLAALTGFEILIAVLQAFVFSVLSCIYLRDALHLDH